MSEGPKAKAQAARETRLRAALRENLKRRKAQARGRTQREAEPDDTAPGRAGAQPQKDEC
jgi:hypothetical protein